MARMDRPTFDATFFRVAKELAKRADCTRRQVGAVITWGNRIWATGYNGPPSSGQPGCTAGACPRGRFTYDEYPGYQQGNQNFSNCISVHAEINALYQFQVIEAQLEEAWVHGFLQVNPPDPIPKPIIYVTDKPCNDCYSALVASNFQIKWLD